MAASSQAQDPISNPSESSNPPPDLSHLWWNTNLSPSQHTLTCPSYLQYAFTHDKERANLSQLDSDFHPLTWPEALDLVATNRLDLFTRIPSELRKYRQYCEDIEREWGSVTNFIVRERLGWRRNVELVEGGFEQEENYKILLNDWPYGFAPGIENLVVWTKFSLPSDESRQDLLPESRAVIDRFVRKKFGQGCEQENVCWFRNWGALKSVGAVEHFHVLVNQAPDGFLRKVTGDQET